VCDAVVNTFMFENCRVLHLEVRIQRKLDSYTTTSVFALQSQFNKAVCNSPLKLIQRCSFQLLGWRW